MIFLNLQSPKYLESMYLNAVTWSTTTIKLQKNFNYL